MNAIGITLAMEEKTKDAKNLKELMEMSAPFISSVYVEQTLGEKNYFYELMF